MQRTPVTSSQIKSIGYDKPSRTLEVEFKKGAIWQYSPVTTQGHKDLMVAESIGSHFHKHIKSNTTITQQKVSE